MLLDPKEEQHQDLNTKSNMWCIYVTYYMPDVPWQFCYWHRQILSHVALKPRSFKTNLGLQKQTFGTFKNKILSALGNMHHPQAKYVQTN